MRRLTSARRRRRCGPAPSQPPPCVHPPVPARGLTSARRAVALQKKPKDDEAEEGGAAEPAAAAAADDDDDDDAALDFSKKKKKKPVRARPARPARSTPRRPPRAGVPCSGRGRLLCRLTPVHTRAVLTRRRAASRPQKAPSAEAEAPAAAAAPAACSDDDEDLAFTSKKKKKRPKPVGSAHPLGRPSRCSRGSAAARHPRSSPPPYPGAGAAGSGLARLALAGAPHSGAACGRVTRCLPSRRPEHGHEPRPTWPDSLARFCVFGPQEAQGPRGRG